ncbi:hypothetical protein PIB30_033172 [Stylosanthes scabra]|uniref:F-box domain-containing protein n=1 Tax=Stylosanthes scabra TaxID=79078 RepID=A0ABU6Z986_9FABA|nr:hypothetical protein [Stylosanthes scabra]
MQTDDKNDAAGKKATRLQLTAGNQPPPNLSEQMIMEILLRLPVRTLCCMKIVCSSWKTLISSPDFVWNHLHYSSLRDPTLTPARIAYYRCALTSSGVKYCGIGVLSVPSMLDKVSDEPTKVACFEGLRYYQICGSCHGLLCLFNDDGHRTHAILWNPCTGFTFQSPDIHGQVCLSGFGYDRLSDTFKFFGIIKSSVLSGSEFITRIYTFGPTPTWRRIDDLPNGLPDVGVDQHGVDDNTKGVYFSSGKACTVNWSFSGDNMAIYFDLGKETYGHFPLPHRVIENNHYLRNVGPHLCVLGNFLSVCYEDKTTKEWILWQMKEYGDPQSWTVLARIPINPQVFYPDRDHCLKPLYISGRGLLLAITSSFRVVLVNLNDDSFDFPVIDGSMEMENQPSFPQCLGSGKIYIYHESLVSPNGLQSNSSNKTLLQFIKPKSKAIVS